MSTVSYALRAEYAGDVEQPTSDGGTQTVPAYGGGLIRLDDARDLNLAEALESGGGIITVDETDYSALNALDARPELKRARGEQAAPADTTPNVGAYDGLNVPELRRELELRGLNTSGRKDELVARLAAHDVALREGPDAASAFVAEQGAGTTDVDAGVAGSTGTAPDADTTTGS